MPEFLQDAIDGLVPQLTNIAIAVAVLIGGWLAAVVARTLTRWGLRRSGLDRRLSSMSGRPGVEGAVNLSSWISRAVYYLILLLVLVVVLQRLQLTIAAESIQIFLDEIFRFLPSIFGAGVLLLVAWITATVLKFLIIRGLKTAKLDDWLTKQAEMETPEAGSVSETLGNVVYWLVFLVFLPAIIGVLGLQGLLEPVQSVVDEVLGALPGIFGAAIILLIGWIAARFVRQVIANLLAGAGLDTFGDRWGIQDALGTKKLSSVIGTVVYVLVLIPVAIAALDTLEIDAVSQPAAEILTTVLAALPAFFGAFLLLGVAYFVARAVSGFVTNALTGIGFNKVLGRIGIGRAEDAAGQTPSQIVGYLSRLAIMLFAVIEASNLLGFGILADLFSQFLVAAGGMVAGVVIFGLGLYFARVADRVIRGTSGLQARLLASVARVTIIVFSSALALRQTGIAEDIVNLAFGIMLGAIGIAVALAFGLGGRDVAAKEIEKWLRSRE
ncbi:MAG: mechanosensitive ion channel [Chloroflexi bacterium]|nr:mechanosensitive ion channel [Chloroflexota bacterium]MDK1044677.1 mechanosensitive ion channel [Anaerolineales bacterium]MCH8340563.1 mechanosensitive ion channel [Chloroflexota bacterium]MCI0771940.1 mechanosensitive ion channel [Chloroflexota bacterium]MCI0805541.1 mechanosensitive ion channel [Chloroflexota bacterium]